MNCKCIYDKMRWGILIATNGILSTPQAQDIENALLRKSARTAVFVDNLRDFFAAIGQLQNYKDVL